MTQVVITASGGVATHNLFAVYFCRDGYMLANWETEDIVRVGKGKAISMIHVSITITEPLTANHEHGRVWGDDNLLFERELFPFRWIKNRLPS